MSVGATARAIGVVLARADLGLGGLVRRGLAAVSGLCIGVRGAAVEALILLGRRRILSRGLGRGFDGYLALRPGQIAGAQRLVLALHQVVLSWLALLVVTRSSRPRSSSKSARKWTIAWRRSSVPASPCGARTEMPCAAR